MPRSQLLCVLWLLPAVLASGRVAAAQSEPQRTSPDASADRHFEVTIGIRMTAQGRPTSCEAGTPVPIDWADQKVELISRRNPNCRARVQAVGGAGAMLIVQATNLRRGQEASATFQYRVTRTANRPDWKAEQFLAAQPASRGKLRNYLRPAPGIQSTDRKIRLLAKELTMGQETEWGKAQAFYRWIMENVQYKEMDFTSAKEALENRIGDCEERSSLFIALCRASRIPARTVWIPGHAYAELHLVDQDRKGHWVIVDPSYPLGFGQPGMDGVILQKGDNVRLPVRGGGPNRLLHPWYQGVNPRPKVEFVQDIRPLGDEATNLDPVTKMP